MTLASDSQQNLDPLLTTEEVAAIFRVNGKTLECDRSRNRPGPPYILIGRLPRYRRSDVIAYIESRRVMHEGAGVATANAASVLPE